MHNMKPVRSSGFHSHRLLSHAAAMLLLVLAAVAVMRGVGQTYVSLLERARGEVRGGVGGSAGHLYQPESLPFGLGSDADFAYLRADALLAQSAIRAKEDEAATEQRAAAIREFRRALRLRPVWGRGWARLAYAKAVIGERDAELFESLAHAVRFAPHDDEVQRMVAWAGFRVWNDLPQPTKQLVWSVITTEKADPRTRAHILRWSVDFGLSEYLAPRLDEAGLEQLERFRRQRAAREARSPEGFQR